MPDPSHTVYDPEARHWTSYLKLWGTRGSVPVAGPQYTAFGGNTSCLEIRREGRLIVIDAGTGIRALGDTLLSSEIREIHIFFGHTHWDHIIGFPFFLPLYNHEFTVHLYAEQSSERSIQDAVTKILKPNYFPVRLEELKAELHYHSLTLRHPVQIADVAITAARCDHPGGALAFRIETPDACVGYVTDHEFLKGFRGAPAQIADSDPLLDPYREVISHLTGCAPLIHEAQYTPREYRSKVGWGHSSIPNATILARLCQIQEWVVTHHDPAADDETLRRHLQLHWQIAEDAGIHCHVSMAFDGLTLAL